MNNFIFNMPTRVLFGAGQLSHLHEEKLPGKKALIVTSNGQSTKKYGYLARVEKELDLAGVEHALQAQRWVHGGGLRGQHRQVSCQ